MFLADNCRVMITENLFIQPASPDGPAKYRVTGTVDCPDAVNWVNPSLSISIRNLSFSGSINWIDETSDEAGNPDEPEDPDDTEVENCQGDGHPAWFNVTVGGSFSTRSRKP